MSNDDETLICPVTGTYCTGNYCDDYGCAKQAGFYDCKSAVGEQDNNLHPFMD